MRRKSPEHSELSSMLFDITLTVGAAFLLYSMILIFNQSIDTRPRPTLIDIKTINKYIAMRNDLTVFTAGTIIDSTFNQDTSTCLFYLKSKDFTTGDRKIRVSSLDSIFKKKDAEEYLILNRFSENEILEKGLNITHFQKAYPNDLDIWTFTQPPKDLQKDTLSLAVDHFATTFRFNNSEKKWETIRLVEKVVNEFQVKSFFRKAFHNESHN